MQQRIRMRMWSYIKLETSIDVGSRLLPFCLDAPSEFFLTNAHNRQTDYRQTTDKCLTRARFAANVIRVLPLRSQSQVTTRPPDSAIYDFTDWIGIQSVLHLITFGAHG